jgi:hypothetical protein
MNLSKRNDSYVTVRSYPCSEESGSTQIPVYLLISLHLL